jgi:hypothetical protein
MECLRANTWSEHGGYIYTPYSAKFNRGGIHCDDTGTNTSPSCDAPLAINTAVVAASCASSATNARYQLVLLCGCGGSNEPSDSSSRDEARN